MKTLLLALPLLLSSTIYSATAISAPIDFIDNNSFTTDTISQLDWLDVSQTNTLSYNYVESQLGSGGRWEGWRFASTNDFNNLIANYTGLPIPNYPYELVHDYSQIITLINLLDPTVHFSHPSLGTQRTIYGLLAKGRPLDEQTTVALLTSYIAPKTGIKTASSSGRELTRNTNKDGLSIGSFLIRESNLIATPIPAAAFLFAPAFLAFMGLRRKAKTIA